MICPQALDEHELGSKPGCWSCMNPSRFRGGEAIEPAPPLPPDRGSVWCEHCRDHFPEEHYDETGSHKLGVGPYGVLLADRDRFGEALEQIRDSDPIDLILDPTWAQRIASAALAGGTP